VTPIEQDSFPQATLTDLERDAKHLRDRLENQQSGPQQPHPFELQAEALRYVGRPLSCEHAERARERLSVQQRSSETPKRRRAATDRDRLTRARDLDRS
jgi:hypothetical protein